YLEPTGIYWPKLSSMAAFFYNTSVHATTGFSPHFLVHGFEATIPSQFLLNEHNNINFEETISHLNDMRVVAQLRSAAASAKRAKYYDQHRRQVNFEPGNLVLLFSPKREIGKPQKLLICRSGPHRIHKQISDATFEIELLLNGMKSRNPPRYDVVHVERLSLYPLPKDIPRPNPLLQIVDDNEPDTTDDIDSDKNDENHVISDLDDDEPPELIPITNDAPVESNIQLSTSNETNANN